ncbi:MULTISPECIES: ABC transporter permease [unclassified Bradyrhizobium]|uniref:ABC transporter permease n=1 Tax=unclassified Bradyrhizobium TaxID=2631580 RepID=UPI0023058EA7|nr:MULTISPECIES: ABC transporter permease [unclassified Bradyrhizobium]MDA9410971.1 ABC transporter permease [Bradyrhizobium sp. CCBAU 45384]MDA9442521.1 ABC transporter permease [Bradyrhizobium sp. CCBAU 51745]
MSSIAISGVKPRAGATDRSDSLRPLALAAPLLLLLAFSFGAPIVLLLSRAVYEPTIANALPHTIAALRTDSARVPAEPVFRALADDLKTAQAAGAIYEFAKTLNTRLPGARSQVLRLARLAGQDPAATKEAMIKAAPLLGEDQGWTAIRAGTNRFTSFFLLSAFDLRWTDQGTIGAVPAEQAVFTRVFGRTFLIATLVTLATLALAFPLAYVMTNVRPVIAGIVLVLVLLPFWTSILVRTAAWTVILQKYGLLNDLLLWLGVTSDRLELMYSRTGLIIAMTHIQLPFTLLPIYSVMRAVQTSQLRAAQSLGARPFTVFRRIYLPQVMPGVLAGCLLTFILCLGYYITPVLVGGASDQLISNFIANYVNVELNWEMAAALSFVLLASTLGLYVTMTRYLGLDLFKMG